MTNNKRPCRCCGDSTDPKDLVVYISGKEADQYRLYSQILDAICDKIEEHDLSEHENSNDCCLCPIADLLVDIGLLDNEGEEMQKEYLVRKVLRDKDALKFEKRRFQRDMR